MLVYNKILELSETELKNEQLFPMLVAWARNMSAEPPFNFLLYGRKSTICCNLQCSTSKQLLKFVRYYIKEC